MQALSLGGGIGGQRNLFDGVVGDVVTKQCEILRQGALESGILNRNVVSNLIAYGPVKEKEEIVVLDQQEKHNAAPGLIARRRTSRTSPEGTPPNSRLRMLRPAKRRMGQWRGAFLAHSDATPSISL
jgi:hypothetical protein